MRNARNGNKEVDERTGIRNQPFDGDARNELGNNSYTDNQGYEDEESDVIHDDDQDGYHQPDNENYRRDDERRWPLSAEYVNHRYQGYASDEQSEYGRYGNVYYPKSPRRSERGVQSFDYHRGQSWGSSVESMRGKGPKGYRRRDDRILEEINDRLTDDSHLDASDIEVAVKNGEVILSGAVRTKKDKRWAEELVESISGVTNLENRIRVSSPSGTEKKSEGPQNGPGK